MNLLAELEERLVCGDGAMGTLLLDRGQCFQEQIRALLEADVDLIFLETFLNFEEMEIALGATPKSDRAIVSLFACDPEGRLQSGMPLIDAFVRCHDMGAKIVGANC